MITAAPTHPHRAPHMDLIVPNHTRLALITFPLSIPSSGQSPAQITIPMFQGLLMLDPVMCSSLDNCATTCHEGCLISCPPCWQTGPWGFQPSVPAILVSYTLLMPLSGSRTGGSMSSLIPRLEAGYMRPSALSMAPSPISLMRTATIATDPPRSMFRLITSPTASHSCTL